MLYKQKSEPILRDELFKNPTSEYRGTPFWSWNCALNTQELERQIENFKDMGFGGFHMHSRTGLDVPYLKEDFFEMINFCVKSAKEKSMLTWAYDEDRWPSGFAGGYVTQNKEFRQRMLVVSPVAIDTENSAEEHILLKKYNVVLDENGFLVNYTVLENETNSEAWYAYEKIAGPDPWHNDSCYVDTFNKKAIDYFCEITHKAYKKHLGNELGNTVPAFFTDEPQFYKKEALAFATKKQSVTLPWSSDFEADFTKTYGTSLLNHLPELLWNFSGETVSQIRYFYHDFVSERFAVAYAENIGGWCEENNCALTGHMMEEPTLKSQTACLGEVMRSLSAFGIPGVDMLCDRREFTTVKQAASVAHQYGREGVLSECYGVTGWEFDFRGHKMQSDWQAALGVSVRAPHLSWVSMQGEAKRDYPASINYQVPWHKRYSLLENHFARVNTAMVRGKARVRVAVVHPVESYWLYWGPQNQSSDVRAQLEENFKNITDWLLFGLVDFDYISESLFAKQCQEGCAPLAVGKHSYEIVIVPDCKTMRSTTLTRLEAFAKQGGALYIAGDVPKYIDAVPSNEGNRLLENGIKIAMNRLSILNAVEKARDIAVYNNEGARCSNLVYGMRQDGEARFLYLAHGKHPRASEETDLVAGIDVLPQENIYLEINGYWEPVLYDTMTGETENLLPQYKTDKTCIPITWNAHDSLLLKLLPQKTTHGNTHFTPQGHYRLGRWAFEKQDAPSPVWDAVPYTLQEPNVLVLDNAQYALDDGKMQGNEEILRLDNNIRKILQYPPRQNGVVQPWVIKPENPTHLVHLLYTIESEIALDKITLALENADITTATFNGKAVNMASKKGWYVDKAIETVELSNLQKGENILKLTIPFGRRTNLEACFLLGNFGVNVCGAKAKITALPTALAFGSIVNQGLPFYGGNIVYHLTVNLDNETQKNWVRSPQYRGALIDISVDNKPMGAIAFAPYQLEIGKLSKGKHTIDLLLYGNRQNTFGALHNANGRWWWHGPDAYRVWRDEFSYGYTLSATGILKSPEFFSESSFAKPVLEVSKK